MSVFFCLCMCVCLCVRLRVFPYEGVWCVCVWLIDWLVDWLVDWCFELGFPWCDPELNVDLVSIVHQFGGKQIRPMPPNWNLVGLNVVIEVTWEVKSSWSPCFCSHLISPWAVSFPAIILFTLSFLFLSLFHLFPSGCCCYRLKKVYFSFPSKEVLRQSLQKAFGITYHEVFLTRSIRALETDQGAISCVLWWEEELRRCCVWWYQSQGNRQKK